MSVSPWIDEGWISGKNPKRSPCCKDAIYASRADGVAVGSCAKCGTYVVRQNPKTGAIEVPDPTIFGPIHAEDAL